MLKVLSVILAFSEFSLQTMAAELVDVELILAVDISGSMDLEEAHVELAGYVDALRHPHFVDAVEDGYLGRLR
ncbi:uncharacterized protein DUF1194 [Ensifer adhaerens]|nr:DUF1194 domain-containing protein [Ensifer adhaerens]RAR98608.1 uncharacterized protein DUF1194 [Ensifer adhaerens]